MCWKNPFGGFILILILALAPGCGATHLPHQVIEQGSAASQSIEPSFAVITDSERWGEFYRVVHANRIPPPPAPEVDWEKNMALFVAAGWKPSSGYRVELEKVEHQGNSLQVRVHFIEPPEGAITAAVMTQPYVLALVERKPGLEKVTFIDAEGKLLAQVNLKPGG